MTPRAPRQHIAPKLVPVASWPLAARPSLPDALFTEVVSRLDVVIPGQPVPKDRPRVGKSRTGRVQTFTSEATVRAELSVAWHLTAALGPAGWPYGGWDDRWVRYAVELHFVLQDDRAHDVDNLTKTVLDAANKLVWPDDSRVCAVLATRRVAAQGEPPSTLVRVVASRGGA